MQDIGPSFGYFPEPMKSVLIVPQHSLEPARAAFADLNQDAFEPWIKEQSTHWAVAVMDLVSVVKNLPHSAYSGLQK
jgi:hypothetical protein